MISCGIPYKRIMRHNMSLWMLSNAFSKSLIELIYSCLCHSVHDASILLGMDERVIPCQLSQFFREPLLGIFTITPFDQSLGILLPSHMDVKSGLSRFAESSGWTLNSSAFSLSCPGIFPFLSDGWNNLFFFWWCSVNISRRFLYRCFCCWWGSV